MTLLPGPGDDSVGRAEQRGGAAIRRQAGEHALEVAQRFTHLDTTLGEPELRNGRYVVPVIFTASGGSAAPQAISISVRNAGIASMHRPAGTDTQFEVSRRSRNTLSYLAVFDERTPLVLDAQGSAVVAEIELTPRRNETRELALDPALTVLGNRGGTQKATTANGRLQIQ